MQINFFIFQSDNPFEKSQDIRFAVADVVEMMCSCGFTAANIQDSVFSCRSIEDAVVFREEIVYVGSFTADGLVEFISDWVQGRASIVIDLPLITVALRSWILLFQKTLCQQTKGRLSVVFRAEIFYAGSFTADELVGFVSDWVQGGASVIADGTRLAIDSSCPTQLDTDGTTKA